MAPKRPKKSVKLPQNTDYSNLSLKNVLCPICRSILIEPVTLPCHHGFCLSCFQGTMANANLVCPLCRVRIGSWLRKVEKQKQLVNSSYWKAIQETFPDKVKNRIEGVEESFEDEDEVPIKLAEPGEIRREYEVQRLNEEMEEKKRRAEEMRASEELIRKIKQEEEYRQLVEEEKIKFDQQIAKQLAKDLSDPGPSAKQGPLDKFLKLKNIKPVDNCDTNEAKNFSVYVMNMKGKKHLQMRKILAENETSDSNDSIGSECRYFKPIDHKNIPQVKSSPIKIPSKIVSASTIRFGAPNGTMKFKHNNDLSPFLPLSTKTYSQLKSECHKMNEITQKSNCNGQMQPVENINKSKKRKNDENTSVVKKAKYDDVTCESPAFLGFTEKEIRERYRTERPMNGQSVRSKSVCDNLEEEMKRKLKQEQDDLEFAKKLQEELNRNNMNRYSTRFSITRNKKKTGRQITLDEIIKPNCRVNI